MTDLNRLFVELLSAKLNEEMKNILKNNLTKHIKHDIIVISNEREVITNNE